MNDNDKDLKNKSFKSGENEVLFPLLFGIIAVILMAIISHFTGN